MKPDPRQMTLPHTKRSHESKTTADSMVEPAKNQRHQVWKYIAECREFGATCDQVEGALEMRHSSTSTRIMELRRMGRLLDTGQSRKTRSGREARVYRAAMKPEWEDVRDGWPAPMRSAADVPVDDAAITIERLDGRIAELETALKTIRERAKERAEGVIYITADAALKSGLP